MNVRLMPEDKAWQAPGDISPICERGPNYKNKYALLFGNPKLFALVVGADVFVS
jgi:hypothetical protein